MKGLLKFITCGSVDDGKSTLIGHMLYDAKLIYADQERVLQMDSRLGSREGKMDYSLLLDGLMAEREQGITIDVAYRYFNTEKRSFIVADTPGHEEYTRNMAVGASFADLAVILVDASRGVLVQTRRHTRICSLMGIRHFVFAVNKMDLVHYDGACFGRLERELKKLLVDFDHESLYVLPVSATEGDNITSVSGNMPWFSGPPLLEYLERVDVVREDPGKGFCMPVQRVSRPDHTFRGFQGQVEGGTVHTGDEVTSLPSGEKARVKTILAGDRETDRAERGQPVTLRLDREVDISRGCVLVNGTEPAVSSMFTAVLLWMDDPVLVAGKSYYIRAGTRTAPATVMNIKYKIDVNSGEHVPAGCLYKNEIAVCDISVSEKIVFDRFRDNRALGGIVLIDRITNMTSACGMIEHSLRRSDNLTWHETDVGRKERAGQKGQRPVTFWFTGLSGSGKSTLANGVEKRLFAMGKHTMLLDGDNIRMGLNRNLGFREQDRIENIRRVAETAKLMNEAGLIVLTAFISPFAQDRRNARDIIGGGDFVEIHVSTPVEVCEKRDVKGLYRKARAGEIPNFTGVSGVYEVPENPDVSIDTSQGSLEENVDRLMKQLEKYLQ